MYAEKYSKKAVIFNDSIPNILKDKGNFFVEIMISISDVLGKMLQEISSLAKHISSYLETQFHTRLNDVKVPKD